MRTRTGVAEDEVRREEGGEGEGGEGGEGEGGNIHQLQCNGARKTHTRKRHVTHDVSNGTRHKMYCSATETERHTRGNGKRHTTY